MRKNRFTKLLQTLYLTHINYGRNSLFESAASCSFGFVFSFVPVLLMVVSLLSGILDNYPDIMNYVLALCENFSSVYDIKSLVVYFSQNGSVTFVNVVLGFFVIWVARTFFLSIARSISRIFHNLTPQKAYVIQLMTFIGEFALILGLIAIVILSFVLNQLFAQPAFEFLRETFPLLFGQGLSRISSLIFYLIIFIFTWCIYRFEPRTAPKLGVCFIFAVLQTVSFFVISIWINKFMNLTNYNIIYGAISSVIILMLKVYFFFMSFLFFAQCLFVWQYLDSLLFCEMYMLPPEDSRKIGDIIKRKLFINPSVLQDEQNTMFLKQGDIIFSNGDESDSVFFIKKGRIIEELENDELIYDKGVFFGEKSAMMKRPRQGTASADCDCEIIRISAENFRSLLLQNPRASAHAMAKL